MLRFLRPTASHSLFIGLLTSLKETIFTFIEQAFTTLIVFKSFKKKMGELYNSEPFRPSFKAYFRPKYGKKNPIFPSGEPILFYSQFSPSRAVPGVIS